MNPEADTEGFDNGDGKEYTTNSVAIFLEKRTRKYLRRLHGQCCNENCGCCPDLGPGPIPSVHKCNKLLITV